MIFHMTVIANKNAQYKVPIRLLMKPRVPQPRTRIALLPRTNSDSVISENAWDI